MLQRTFGADAQFLARHKDRYQEALKAEYLVRARWLIRKGRRMEAREELRLAGGGTLPLRLLTAIPGPLAQGMVGLAAHARHRILRLLMNNAVYAVSAVSLASSEYL
jgi:hypothetical protein